ncbi:MAG: NAD(P)-dependent oxidoreductase [Halobacteriaceae archaeon]
MHLAIFGATGRTGIPLVDRALDSGHVVTAFLRDPAKLDREHERLQVVEGDAYTGAGVVDAVQGVDAVVSVLGQTSAGPSDLLTVAGRRIMDAMEREGVDRFVTLVGAGVHVEGARRSLTGRVIGWALKLLNPDVLEDADAHVADVRARQLRWTVLRAPRLSDAAPRGEYRTGDVTPGRQSVARADVAAFILEVLEDERYIRELPKITY